MEILQEIIKNHLGKAIGIIVGLIFGLLAIKYGFLKALFVVICIGIGYYIGRHLDEKYDFKEIYYKLFRER